MNVREEHDLKETITVDINTPGHEPRGAATPLFRKTREELLQLQPGCWCCGAKEGLEAHHFPIERSLAGLVDWALVTKDAKEGNLGKTPEQRKAAASFDFTGIEDDPYRFVDNMLVNGLILCKKHHTGKEEGIHATTGPIWEAQRYAKEGYKFNEVEIIHHAQ